MSPQAPFSSSFCYVLWSIVFQPAGSEFKYIDTDTDKKSLKSFDPALIW